MNTEEIWRVISDHPDYEISNMGRCRRATKPRSVKCKITWPGKILPMRWRKGDTYPRYSLYDGTQKLFHACRIHRLVANAFLGPCPTPKHRVAHWDGNPKNNNVSNLRWATQKENVADTARHGRIVHGEKTCNAKLTDEKVRQILGIRQSGLKMMAIAKIFDVSLATISRIIRREKWKHVVFVEVQP